MTMLLSLKCQAAHRAITYSAECKEQSPEGWKTLESLPIRASLPFVPQRGPRAWAAPRDSRGFEPARCRSGQASGSGTHSQCDLIRPVCRLEYCAKLGLSCSGAMRPNHEWLGIAVTTLSYPPQNGDT